MSAPERRKDFINAEKLIVHTVHTTLISLGFTVDDPVQVQRDMSYLRTRRTVAEDNFKVARKAIVTTGFSGIVLFIGDILVHWAKSKN